MANQTQGSEITVKLDEDIKRATLDKIRAEADQILRSNHLIHRLVSAVPMFTVMLTVASLVGGGLAYFNDRYSQRQLQQSQIVREHMARVLSFAVKPEIATSDVTFAAIDMNKVLERDKESASGIAIAILDVITNQADYSKTRDVHFVKIMAMHFVPVRDALKDRQAATFVLYRIRRALEELAEQDEPYFRTMRLPSPREGYSVVRYTDEVRYLHFTALVDASQAVLDAVQDETIRSQFKTGFGEALHNQDLARDIFGRP